ncbi:hypothetical protein Hanom_Chr08g00743321 [Helianthus anomalus]
MKMVLVELAGSISGALHRMRICDKGHMIEQHNKKFQLKVTGEKLLNLMLRFNWRRLSLEFIMKYGRSEMGVPEFGWTTQKVFHLMNLLDYGLSAKLFQ